MNLSNVAVRVKKDVVLSVHAERQTGNALNFVVVIVTRRASTVINISSMLLMFFLYIV